MSALHSKQTTAQGIHTTVAFEFANAADRVAGTVATPSGYTVTAADVGKVGKQTDDATYWILNGTGPLVWVQIGGAIAGVTPDDMLVFAASGVGITTTARFLPFGYTPNTAPIGSVALRAARSGTLSNLRVRHNTAGVGGNITYTLRRNGVDTVLTCAVPASSSSGADTTNSVAIAADDLLEVRATKGASITTSPAEVTATVKFTT